MKDKARLERLLQAKRRQLIKEPPPRENPPPIPKKPPPPPLKGCVFTKSCALPNGVINHSNPGGFVPVESLKQYGTFAVLGTGSAVTAGGTALQWVGGSGSALALAARLGGTLALAGSTAVGFAALLMPNDTSADSAFYTSEQYAHLSQGNTRVRVKVKHLPDGSVSVYGFYTGTKTEWQQVPVIEAQARGDQLVADIGNGIEIIWTPAADPNTVLGIPALEGASLKPGTWVYPPTEQADKILVNPEHPPDYQDAIIWFPSTSIQPIYISLSVPGDHSYHTAPKGLTAFPDAVRDKAKSSVQGGGKKRTRWKDPKGRIYEWDSQHGAVELYDKQGKHLGEFNPETGEQTKPAKPGRTTPK
ncbi:S-type pyocin domain-containing protein [Pseudomonas entomophila]|uniref:colicin E3/pyocin S6 family cytotoxin n=1 Tax=Pseudomonas entomophila TaxID=312306 RepID=UPI001BCB7BF3|nr:colicin E3/pyocin S6 family cytotoxin [Pseudomonas entomophila]QVM92058.1 S-type pyocin domain-containing protein [Pseudomonas entomophila]